MPLEILSRAILHGALDDFADLRDLVNAHERVHFRQQFRQLVAETLRQAAGNNQALAAIFGGADFGGFENRVHAFFLRGINERAGVDDERVGLLGVVRDFDAAFEQRAEHDFGVHEIFRAAERNQADAQRTFVRFFSFGHGRKILAEIWREAILRNGSRGRSPHQNRLLAKIISPQSWWKANWSGRFQRRSLE